MATPHGAAGLLSALASLDPRVRVDGPTAAIWAAALHDIPDEILIPAGIEAVRNNTYGGQINVGMIIEAAKPAMHNIARSVRSAKLRGLVPTTWPEHQPLPHDAQEQLRQEFEATNNYANEIEATPKRRAVAQRHGGTA